MFSEFKNFNPEYYLVFMVILGMSLAAPGFLYALRRKTLTHGGAFAHPSGRAPLSARPSP